MATLHRQLARITAVSAAAAVLASAAVHARPVPDLCEEALVVAEPTARVAQRGGGVSLQDARAIAQQRYRGRVVSAQTIMIGGRLVHEIRIEDGERVRTVRIDAQSGQIM